MADNEQSSRKCPECVEGYILGLPYPTGVSVTCDICRGSGVLPDGIVYDPAAGRRLRDERKATGKTLREWAIENNVNAAERSRLERGYFPVDQAVNQ